MSKRLSLDLRFGVPAGVAEVLGYHVAAARFGVSSTNVSGLRRLARVKGDPRPRALGRFRRSGRIEARRALILGVLAETPDITNKELRCLLAGRELDFGYGRTSAYSFSSG